MVRFHHVNLGVPVGGAEAEGAFLVDLLGMVRLDSPPEAPQAKWFECADGSQIHLSEDPEHRAPARAHVAVELGADLSALEIKFDSIGYEYSSFDGMDLHVVFCEDPAGNRWELRGAPHN
jgi:catechol 2,3-dioxygenase-like lactoylglutathione lyase family enzyme